MSTHLVISTFVLCVYMMYVMYIVLMHRLLVGLFFQDSQFILVLGFVRTTATRCMLEAWLFACSLILHFLAFYLINSFLFVNCYNENPACFIHLTYEIHSTSSGSRLMPHMRKNAYVIVLSSRLNNFGFGSQIAELGMQH